MRGIKLAAATTLVISLGMYAQPIGQGGMQPPPGGGTMPGTTGMTTAPVTPAPDRCKGVVGRTPQKRLKNIVVGLRATIANAQEDEPTKYIVFEQKLADMPIVKKLTVPGQPGMDQLAVYKQMTFLSGELKTSIGQICHLTNERAGEIQQMLRSTTCALVAADIEFDVAQCRGPGKLKQREFRADIARIRGLLRIARREHSDRVTSLENSLRASPQVQETGGLESFKNQLYLAGNAALRGTEICQLSDAQIEALQPHLDLLTDAMKVAGIEPNP